MTALASAQEQQSWINDSGGSFGLPANWSTAIPTGDDRAWFDLQSSGYSVQLDQNRSIGAWLVAQDTVTLNLGGHNLNLTDPSSGDWNQQDDFTGMNSLMIGRGTSETGHTGSLTIQGGGTFTTAGITLGGTRASTGTLIVEGAGTIFNSLGNGVDNTTFGYRGDSVFIVQDGAVANFDRITLNRVNGSTTQVTIQGTDTQVNFDFFDIALRGQANVTVRDGAKLTGVNPGSNTGRVEIVRNNSSLTIDNATASVGRTRVAIHSSSVGTLRVINGGELSIADSLTVASVEAGAVGIVEVDGSGSQLSTTGRIMLGGSGAVDNGANGRLSITNGAAVQAGNIVNVWSNSSILVEGGSSLTAYGLEAVSGSTLEIVLRGGEHGAMITTTGPTTVIDGMVLEIAAAEGFSATLGDTFTLLEYNNSLSGTFADLQDGATIHIGDYAFELTYGSGNSDSIALQVTAIPEPGAAAALVSGLVLLVAITYRLRRLA